jgi:2'-5' RNA ligase
VNKKYFIAIVLPSPLLNEVEAIKYQFYSEYNLKGALRSPAHITLHRPFEWKEVKEHELIKSLKNFSFQKPFSINLKNYNFFEPRVIYIDVSKNEDLFELHKQLKIFAQKELKLFNEVNDARGFKPHITIAFRDLKKPLFYALKTEFETKEFSNSFNYNGISLLKFEKKWEVIHDFIN